MQEMMTGPAFRSALESVPPLDRDAWVDSVLGIDEIPDDGPELPAGCVPYLPCPVDTLLRMVDLAGIEATDVLIDVGSGIGRALAVIHLLTGAGAIGLEIQPELVQTSKDIVARLEIPHVGVVQGDAARLAGYMTVGSVFFLYCPFSGPRLERVLDDLEDLAQARHLRVCTVDLPLPERPWLTCTARSRDLVVYTTQ